MIIDSYPLYGIPVWSLCNYDILYFDMLWEGGMINSVPFCDDEYGLRSEHGFDDT